MPSFFTENKTFTIVSQRTMISLALSGFVDAHSVLSQHSRRPVDGAEPAYSVAGHHRKQVRNSVLAEEIPPVFCDFSCPISTSASSQPD
mmetsp:Transcript_12334/g.25180  ORF Transcript_12334/g.25180 Transcript_12334/m.25180 type:complete len:89 (-) Transcript_12334:100-366(-)